MGNGGLVLAMVRHSIMCGLGRSGRLSRRWTNTIERIWADKGMVGRVEGMCMRQVGSVSPLRSEQETMRTGG